MRLWVLGSGSAGNATLIEEGEHRLLIDAGFELPALVARIRAADVAPASIDDVVLTHGHRDHLLGAASGARIYGWRVWCSLGTVWRWRALRFADVAPFTPGDTIELAGFRIRTVPTPHDVDDSAALVVESRVGRARAAICTDLGWVPPALRDALRGVSTLVLESNYDPTMLEHGPYGPELRRRVSGRTGHLSNGQAARLVRSLAGEGLAHVILAHISRHNNTPEIAINRMRRVLAQSGSTAELRAARQDEVLGPIEVRPPAG